MLSSSYVVAGLLEKANSSDADFRYMAINDLMTELAKSSSSHYPSSSAASGGGLSDAAVEKKVVATVLKLIQDKNGEVSSLAVKCLAPLVKKIQETQLKEIVDTLCSLLASSTDDTYREIASIGLKTVILEVPVLQGLTQQQQHKSIAAKLFLRLVPKLIDMIKDHEKIQIDTIDIISDLLARFGHFFKLDAASATVQKQLQASLFPLLCHRRAVVRKRATLAIGNLACTTSTDQFHDMTMALLNEIEKKRKQQLQGATDEGEVLRTLMSCLTTFCRSNPVKFVKHLPTAISWVFQFVETSSDDHHDSEMSFDDELGEICLQSLETFLLKCPAEITPYIDQIIGVALKSLKYDPNYHDEEEEDEEDEDGDVKMNGDGDDLNMDAADDDEEEDDDDDGFGESYSDDEDQSWKVRRASSKLLAAIISTHPQLLSSFANDNIMHKTVAPTLISRFKEREESVRIDILNTVVCLIRMSGITSSSSSTSKDTAARSANELSDTNSPISLLSAHVPNLVKKLLPVLNSKSIQTRNTGFLLLKELGTVLQAGGGAGLDDVFGLLVPSIVESLTNFAATAHHSLGSTSSNLKISVLEFLRVCFISPLSTSSFGQEASPTMAAMLSNISTTITSSSTSPSSSSGSSIAFTNSSIVFQPHLPRLLPAISQAVSNKYYKIAIEALLVLVEIVPMLGALDSGSQISMRAPKTRSASKKMVVTQQGGSGSLSEHSAVITEFVKDCFKTVVDRLQLTDIDLEVKEKAIVALGCILSHFGYLFPDSSVSILPLLMERLKNELTKLTTMRVLRALVTCKVSESSDEHLLAFTPAVIDIVVAECVACMKKSHRQLKVAALGLLENLIREQPRLAMSSSSSSKKRSSASSTVASAGGSVMSESVMDIVLPELKVLFIDSDLHILPLAFTTLVVCIEFHPSKVIPQIRSDALVQSLVSTILHSPHLVASGSALDALLDFWKCYVLQGGEMGLGDVLVREVFDLVVGSALSYSADATAASIAAAKTAFAANSPSSTEVLSKLSLSIVSKSLSTVLIACGTASWSSNVQKDVFATLVADMEKPLTAAQLQQPPLTCREEVSKYISIMTIGEMGAHVDLSQAHSGLDQILQQILTQPTFSEELKHAAAFSLGNIALGNLQHYMPTVLSCVNSFGKKRYLMFISLKEIIGEAISPDTQGQTPLDPFVDQIWNLLFTYLEEEMEEGTRSSISEVLGKLSTIRPAQFIEALRTKLVSNSANARATVVTAIRFTFNTYTKDVREFDELLKPIIIQFFALIKDSDLNVKKLALATLNSAAHNKPALLKKSLDDLLPLLYAETVVNRDLIRIVEMGPFKHTVDDGLEARKAAFDTCGTLLESCLPNIEIFAFLQCILNGLSDESFDVRILVQLILQRLAIVSPTAVSQKLDDVVEPLKATILTPVKANAVKQEVEQTNELVRSAVKTGVWLWKNLLEGGSAGASGGSSGGGAATGMCPKFEEFAKEVLFHEHSAVAEVVRQVSNEIDSVSSKGTAMDLS